MSQSNHIPLLQYHELPLDDMRHRAAEFCSEMRNRRTVRQFSDRPVPREIATFI